MKKLIVFTIVVFYVVTSCVEKDTCHSESTVPDEAQSALITALQDFNQGLIDVSLETRGFWNSGSGRRNKIINADVSGAFKFGKKGYKLGGLRGAIVSAIVGGGLSSLIAFLWPSSVETDSYDCAADLMVAAYVSLKADDDCALFVDYNLNGLGIPSEYCSSALTVASYHNAILGYVMTDDDDYEVEWENLPEAEAITLDDATELIIGEIEISVLYSPEFIALCNEVETNFVYTIQDFSGDDAGTDGEIISLFVEAVAEYVEDFEDIEYLISEYAQLIESSDELSDSEKQCVYNGLAVAAFSYIYWYDIVSD